MPGRLTTTRTLAALGAATAVVAALMVANPASGAPAELGEPRASTSIAGTWAAGMGEVTVTGSGTSFTGTVSKKTGGFLCEHPVGEVIWTITGEGPAYGGQARFDFNTGCPGPMSSATFVLLDSELLQVNYVGPTGLSATMYLAYRVSGGGSDGGDPGADTTAPVVEAIGSSVPMAEHSRPTLKYRVSDDSGKARVHITFYSDGTPVISGDTKAMQKATGKKVYTARSKVDPTYLKKPFFGPFYFCVWAEDPAGNKSEGWPNSSCAWRPIEVSFTDLLHFKKVNGCGPDWGYISTGLFNLALDKRTWGTTTVNFRPACYAHDAGYWGYAFENPVTGQSVDTRPMTRNQVDLAFRADLDSICASTLQGQSDLITLCQTHSVFGATNYYAQVDQEGRGGFDSDATMVSHQQEMPLSPTNPPDGGRDPGPPR